ncbi:hypothetical protein DUNSADRAFT_3847 [Dunaliella salina]|uniref:Uncharacterized protein n=1 Tax=Dunaliella salina TaxID=3046 RepID=A0ABQ7GT43_DUNSA|nr:hypothetical protein DUNSADRAFT_3847 [Dunaliella salina]|eukprot:KAF5837775.1 hypothetical protein DUNSADRAFT_3847 [Dunaliella salina]
MRSLWHTGRHSHKLSCSVFGADSVRAWAQGACCSGPYVQGCLALCECAGALQPTKLIPPMLS